MHFSKDHAACICFNGDGHAQEASEKIDEEGEIMNEDAFRTIGSVAC